ncbi:hypothetical protein GCM10027348_33130 [Hymenobacter tenuis]
MPAELFIPSARPAVPAVKALEPVVVPVNVTKGSVEETELVTSVATVGEMLLKLVPLLKS